MSTAVQVEIVIPESMGKVEALAKVSTSLQGSLQGNAGNGGQRAGKSPCSARTSRSGPRTGCSCIASPATSAGTPCATCGIGMRKRSRYDGG